MLESRGWNSGDDEEAMNKHLMSYTGEIMMAIDSIDDGNDLSENERLLMFKNISEIIKQDRIRVRPQNQKAHDRSASPPGGPFRGPRRAAKDADDRSASPP